MGAPEIDRTTVLRLADAAAIELVGDEIDRIAAQLTDILEQIATLADYADAPHQITTAASPIQPLRDDVLNPDLLAGTLSRYAPELREGFFTLPKLPTHRAG